MGFVRAGLRASQYLKDYMGSFIGLQFAGVIKNQTTTFDDGTVSTRDVVRARIVNLSPDGTKGTFDGELLVHQSVLAAELMARPDDWHLGVLTETPHSTDSSRTVYVLTPPVENTIQAFEAAEKTISDLRLV